MKTSWSDVHCRKLVNRAKKEKFKIFWTSLRQRSIPIRAKQPLFFRLRSSKKLNRQSLYANGLIVSLLDLHVLLYLSFFKRNPTESQKPRGQTMSMSLVSQTLRSYHEHGRWRLSELPKNEEFVDENGVRTTIEYVLNEDGKKVKVSPSLRPSLGDICWGCTDHPPHQAHSAKIHRRSYCCGTAEMGQVWSREGKQARARPCNDNRWRERCT